MVYRIYVEKKSEFAQEAAALLTDLQTQLQLTSLKGLRLLQRYDVEMIEEAVLRRCRHTVFSEPQLDIVTDVLNLHENESVFAVEYLPGQFDQRADSCAQCIQFVSGGDRPIVRTATIYLLLGILSDQELEAIKKYVINPVESREAKMDPYETLTLEYQKPDQITIMEGFLELKEEGLNQFLKQYSLAMDLDDLRFCQDYFKKEKRNPTLTEIKMIDTYWSDHCRHTTFSTIIDSVEFDDEVTEAAYTRYLDARQVIHGKKPVTLMDLATMGVRCLKAAGKLEKLDESEEINACTVKIKVDDEDWLLLFKNETHNHPTEIEPFGGAATCIGGAIRDPLSGRAYVYQAMRVTGAGDPLTKIQDTMPGKLPQRKLVTTAADGYSAYGNQIGLATGLVDEIYHPGYVAKRMEIGAVIGAVKAAQVRREVPKPGDLIILLGGRTGRDGCGGATGSSKSHNLQSIEQCGAEVQKGNAPEERKLQRLFRNEKISRMIKRCNDFGAGGVSVAIGELADGVHINLDKIPKKYEGLDGTELAISESQERMAVVIEKQDEELFLALALEENIEATVVAKVLEKKQLTMEWNGQLIVNLSRQFLNSNGAVKTASAIVKRLKSHMIHYSGSFKKDFRSLAQDLNICSKRGLKERFDSTIGSGTVLMPLGGKYQMTPPQAMAAKIPVIGRETNTCSLMAYGFNPYLSEESPYEGAYAAVVESVSKLVACGAGLSDCYLSFQEYFERLGTDPIRWGKPLSALLGAFEAQLDLGIAAIGGKDSMSGSFEALSVPPTLVSFAVTTAKADRLISPEFKSAGNKAVLFSPSILKHGQMDAKSLLSLFHLVRSLIKEKKAISAYTPTYGGLAEGILKMCFGNRIGFRFAKGISENLLFDYRYGSFLLELSKGFDVCELLERLDADGIKLFDIGTTTAEYEISGLKETLSLDELQEIYEGKLEPVFPCNIAAPIEHQKLCPPEAFSFDSPAKKAAIHIAKPKVLIPVFPGTNCEYDTARAFSFAGAETEIVVIKNIKPGLLAESVNYFAKRIDQVQIIAIPGGFSGGDEPDGSGKFITAFFRNKAISDAVHNLLKQRDGLMCGICNGFQALLKLGLLPYGEIRDITKDDPTLTYNRIGRHQSKMVTTRVASNLSPWLMDKKPGELYTVAVSHGEGRFVCPPDLLKALAEKGQIATQYTDFDGTPSLDIRFNPNGSAAAVEGITSPDGRIFGKMGHSERFGDGLYRNVDGNYNNGMFENSIKYFQ